MRVALVSTSILSGLALALSCLSAPAAAAPSPTPGWSNTQFVSARDGFYGLVVAPDGYAVTKTWSREPNGCDASCYSSYNSLLAREPGGTWVELPLDSVPTYPVFDSDGTGWGLVTGPSGAVLVNRPPHGSWSTGEAIPLTSALLTLTDDGRPVLLAITQVGDAYTFQVAIRTDAGWVTRTRTTDDDSPRVTAGPGGTVRLAWRRAEGREVVLSDLRSDGTWSPDKTVLESDRAVSEVSWLGPRALGFGYLTTSDYTTDVVGEGPDGVWGHELADLHQVDADAGGPGDLVTLTSTAGDHLVARQQQSDGGWSRPVTLGDGLGGEVKVDARGNATAVWLDADYTLRYAQHPVNGSWTSPRPTPQAVSTFAHSLVVGIDGAGTVTVGATGVRDGVRGLYTADLSTPVAVSRIDRAPSRSWAAGSSFRVGWRTTWDRASTHDVRYRVRRVTGTGFVGHRLASGTKATITTVHGKAGRVYCLSVRAHLGATTGPWGRETCVATPLDDRSLKAGKGWQRVGGSTVARRTGARLVSPRISGTRFALLVHPSSRASRIRVTLGGHLLGTFRVAKGTPRSARVLGLKAFKTTRQGKLVVTVVSSGRPVRISGVYAR